MRFFCKYLAKRLKMCFRIDHRTVKIVNVLVCLAWILSFLLNTELNPNVLPAGLAFDNHELWITIFSIVGIVNLTGIATDHFLSKHYAFLSAVVLWATISTMALVANLVWAPTFWVYAFLSALSAIGYCTIENDE